MDAKRHMFRSILNHPEGTAEEVTRSLDHSIKSLSATRCALFSLFVIFVS